MSRPRRDDRLSEKTRNSLFGGPVRPEGRPTPGRGPQGSAPRLGGCPEEKAMDFGFTGLLVALVIGLIWIWNSLYVIKEWERGVVLRLGRMIPEPKSAGIRLVFWPIETLYRISLRTE